MARDLPTGVVRTATGYRTFQWVPDPARPNGRVKTKRWKHDATDKAMIAWREEQRAAARKPTPVAELPVVLTGFAADATVYLEAVTALESYSQRVKHIAEWIGVFGDEPIAAVTPVRIRTQRDRWLTVGPQRVLEKRPGKKAAWVEKPIPLSASSVNQRLRALENFFTVVHPTRQNPVRQVDEVEGPDPEPRGYTFAIALEVLSFMPDITRPKKGETIEKGSLSRARFETMLWTSLPEIQLAQLKPDVHIDWIAGTYLRPRRQKGKKSRRARRRREQPQPLLPQAIAALKRFFALGAQHGYPWSSNLGKSVKRAIRAANVVRQRKGLPLIPESATVYDLTRHTFGTEAMRASQNLKAVQELMGHQDINQTARYAMAAVTEGTAIAVQQLAAHAAGRGGFRRQGEGKVSPHKPRRSERSRRQRTVRKR